MSSIEVLYTQAQLSDMVSSCASFIDNIVQKDKDTVVCPILQSSFMFVTDVFKQLQTQPTVDFCGVSRYDSDDTIDELFMYKSADVNLYVNKTAIVVDVLCSTGTTINLVQSMLKQMGARKVYTATLLVRQFTKHKPDWSGFVISDELVCGYGLDIENGKYRTLPHIAYAQ